MNLTNATVLVTGAGRGLGRDFARLALERGAAKVYAAARRPEDVDLPDVETLRIDVTNSADIEAAAALAVDVDLLVNNAGISTRHDLVTGDLAQIHAEIDVHFFGTLGMTRAFAPVLAANGGGAIVNVMSALSFQPFIGANAYSAGKAAQWMLTNAVRLELASQGTQVLGAHLAATATDMMAGYEGPMNEPADVVTAVYDALEAGDVEVLVDDDTRAAKAALTADPNSLFPAR